MSYDLQVWSVRAFDPSALEGADWLHPVDAQWIFEGKTWQISVSRSNRVLAEDIPEEVAGTLPGIHYLTDLSLEGKATAEAMRMAQSTANKIAKALHGTVFDPQEGTTVSPPGVKRFVPAPTKQEAFTVLDMSWWFLESPLASSSGRRAFVDFLERHLPEALPKRYGGYEPPQFVYEETGKEHFLEFLSENVGGIIIWYPRRPVATVLLQLAPSIGGTKRGFRTHRLNIEIESDVLLQPGWPEALQNFWRSVSKIVQPIYGEVRTLGGRIRRGGSLCIAPKNETSVSTFGPTKSWWWRGVPTTLGSAVVLGAEYQKLWQAFMEKAHVEDGLAFASTEDWTSPRDLAGKIGSVPPSILMVPETDRQPEQRYPETWPFASPFLETDPRA